EVTTEHGVTIVGTLNLPATLPVHASQMYGKVITNFIDLLINDGEINLDFEDEILAGMCITHDGEIVHERTREMMGMAALTPAEPESAPETEPVEEEAEPADESLASIDTDKLKDLEEADSGTTSSDDVLPIDTDGPLVRDDAGESSGEGEPVELDDIYTQ